MLRPRPHGNLAGGPGGEPWLLVSLRGVGLSVLHPGPWQPARGCRPQQRQGPCPAAAGACLQAGLRGCAGVRTSGKKGKKTAPFDYFHHRFPRLVFCLVRRLGNIIRKILRAGGACGGGAGAQRETGGIKAISVSATLFPVSQSLLSVSCMARMGLTTVWSPRNRVQKGPHLSCSQWWPERLAESSTGTNGAESPGGLCTCWGEKTHDR